MSYRYDLPGMAQTFRSAMSMKFGPESQTHGVCAPAPEAKPTVTQALVGSGAQGASQCHSSDIGEQDQQIVSDG